MNDINAFLGKHNEPAKEEVATALGAAASTWNELLGWLREEENLRN